MNLRYYTANEDISVIRCNVAVVTFVFASSILTGLMLFQQQHQQASLSNKDIALDIAMIIIDIAATTYGLMEAYNVIKYAFPTQVIPTADLELGGMTNGDVVPFTEG